MQEKQKKNNDQTNNYKKTNGSSKLDGVGPDDNRPSADQFHQFVKKNFDT